MYEDIIRNFNQSDYKRKRNIVEMIKLSRGCAICGYNKYASALDFHHIDRNTKIENVSTMVHNGNFSIDDILEEIGKCEVLCANCHRELSQK